MTCSCEYAPSSTLTSAECDCLSRGAPKSGNNRITCCSASLSSRHITHRVTTLPRPSLKFAFELTRLQELFVAFVEEQRTWENTGQPENAGRRGLATRFGTVEANHHADQGFLRPLQEFGDRRLQLRRSTYYRRFLMMTTRANAIREEVWGLIDIKLKPSGDPRA